MLCLILIISIGIWFKKLFQFPLDFSPSSIFLCLYLGFSTIGIVAALNTSEALYETSKILLFTLTFFSSVFFIQRTRAKIIQSIALFSMVAICLAIFFSLREFFEALRHRSPLSSTVYLVSGLHGHKNLLASWIMLLMPLSAVGLFIKTRVPWMLCSALLFISAGYLIALQTRAVYVGLIIGLAVYLLFQFGLKKTKPYLFFKTFLSFFFGSILLLILITLFTPFTEQLLSSISVGSSSVQERLILWQKTITLIKQHFLWGVGGGNWKFLFPSLGIEGLYRAELNNTIFIRPHNDLLWIWVEHGLLSLLAYLGFLYFAIAEGVKLMLSKDEYSKPRMLGIAGVFAYLGMSFFDFPMERIEHQIAFALLLAIVVSEHKSKPLKHAKKGIQKVLVSVSIILVGFCLYMGWSRYQAETHMRQMIVHKDVGNNELLLNEAKKINQRFIQTDNNAIPIAWYEGNAYFNLGRQAEAISSYLEAVEINPYNYSILSNAGTGYFLKKDYQMAITYYLKALKVNPNFDDAKLNLTTVYVNLGQWDMAAQWLAQVSAVSSRSEQLRQAIEANR